MYTFEVDDKDIDMLKDVRNIIEKQVLNLTEIVDRYIEIAEELPRESVDEKSKEFEAITDKITSQKMLMAKAIVETTFTLDSTEGIFCLENFMAMAKYVKKEAIDKAMKILEKTNKFEA